MAWHLSGDKPLPVSMMTKFYDAMWLLPGSSELTHLPLDKMAAFSKRHVQTHFLEWKYLIFKQNFFEICSLGSNWQYVSIGPDNGLAPFWRQAIIWTDADPVHQRICSIRGRWINSLRLNDASMHQSTLLSMVQITACCQFCTKP